MNQYPVYEGQVYQEYPFQNYGMCVDGYYYPVPMQVPIHFQAPIQVPIQGPMYEKEVKKSKDKKDTRCYTCKPRGKVKQHIISDTKHFVFHHDMHKRPIILVSPKRHISTMSEMSKEERDELFIDIDNFVKSWNIEDYQINYNAGDWQKNSHFHAKIRISDKIANRMRRDHFSIIKFENRYKPAALET
jgi:galactose-1-phosphate uridylyltransferase